MSYVQIFIHAVDGMKREQRVEIKAQQLLKFRCFEGGVGI